MIITIASKLDGQSFSPETLEVLINSISGDQILLFSGISIVSALIAFPICVRRIHKSTFRSIVTSRSKVDFKRIGLGFLLIIILRAIVLILETKLYGESITWNFQPTKFINLVIICLLLIPLQAAFEEVFFRGYLLQGIFKSTQKKYLSMGITSIIFTIVHFANAEAITFGWSMFLFYLVTAIFLALVVHFDNGTELSIGIHTGINVFTLTMITSEWSSYQTSSLFLNASANAFKFDLFMLAVIIYPLLFLMLAWKYKWNFPNKKNTLLKIRK